jgi:hypothetical protein
MHGRIGLPFMRVQVTKALVLALMSIAAAGVARANIIYINSFNLGQTPPPGGLGPNAPASPTNANGVHALGVMFAVTEGGVGTSNAIYGATENTGLNQLAPLTDPVLAGNADDVITLTFDLPTTFLSFDVAYSTSTGPGGTVTINGSNHPFTTTGNSGAFGAFSIGQFSLTPGGTFTQATIALNDASSDTFLVDNLSYDEPSSGTPEPGSVVLLVPGLLVFGLVARKRQK